MYQKKNLETDIQYNTTYASWIKTHWPPQPCWSVLPWARRWQLGSAPDDLQRQHAEAAVGSEHQPLPGDVLQGLLHPHPDLLLRLHPPPGNGHSSQHHLQQGHIFIVTKRQLCLLPQPGCSWTNPGGSGRSCTLRPLWTPAMVDSNAGLIFGEQLFSQDDLSEAELVNPPRQPVVVGLVSLQVLISVQSGEVSFR